jgi:hypothetical protein
MVVVVAMIRQVNPLRALRKGDSRIIVASSVI